MVLLLLEPRKDNDLGRKIAALPLDNRTCYIFSRAMAERWESPDLIIGETNYIVGEAIEASGKISATVRKQVLKQVNRLFVTIDLCQVLLL
jgi:hypothetical protein